MKKQIIQTDLAPLAIGPYSQAVVSGNYVFVSGQLPLDNLTLEIVQGDIDVQAEKVLNNIAAILSKANLGLEDVVKTTVFLTDMDKFPLVNTVYERFFPKAPPARSCVEVRKLPKGALIEIDVIASRQH